MVHTNHDARPPRGHGPDRRIRAQDPAPGSSPDRAVLNATRARPLSVQLKCSRAPVAQLDRAFASGAKGRWFESTRAYHIFNHLTRCRPSSPTQNLPNYTVLGRWERLL